jgi:ketosteroid isomerase-like protein
MHKSGLLVGTLAAAALLAWGFGAPALAAEPKAEITELEHKCAAAATIDELMTCYDEGEGLVVYDISTPREFDGPKAVRADFQNFFDTFKNPKIEFINLHVTTDGRLGFAESVQHMTATDKNGKPVDFIFRVTDVWRKEKQQTWKIIHSHISFPIDMASGKADMQSK